MSWPWFSPLPLTSTGSVQSHGWLTANCKECQEMESGCVPREKRQMFFDEQMAVSTSNKIMSLLCWKHFSCFSLHLKPHSSPWLSRPASSSPAYEPQALPLSHTDSAPAFGAFVQCCFSFDIPKLFIASGF